MSAQLGLGKVGGNFLRFGCAAFGCAQVLPARLAAGTHCMYDMKSKRVLAGKMLRASSNVIWVNGRQHGASQPNV